MKIFISIWMWDFGSEHGLWVSQIVFMMLFAWCSLTINDNQAYKVFNSDDDDDDELIGCHKNGTDTSTNTTWI